MREEFRHAMPVKEGVGEGDLLEGAVSGGGLQRVVGQC